MSHASRCTHKLAIRRPDGTMVKLPFKSGTQFWALDANGELRRVRHRDQLPAGLDVGIVALPADASDEDRATAAVLLRAGASDRIDREIPGAIAGTAGGARRQSPSRTGAQTVARPVMLGEGGIGVGRGPLDELWVLSKSHRGGTATSYEDAQARLARQRALVSRLTASSPDTLVSLVDELRNGDKLRATAIAIAVDAAVAGHPSARALLNVAMVRPDDPGVALQYFFDSYGKSSPLAADGAARGVPASLRKALGDAAGRLYSEHSHLAYDRRRTQTIAGKSTNPVTFADVIRVAHAKPGNDAQAALFAYLTNDRNLDALDPDLRARLGRVVATRALTSMPAADQHAALGVALADARTRMAAGWSGELVHVDGPLGALHWRTLREQMAPTDDMAEARAVVAEAKAALRAAGDEARFANLRNRRAWTDQRNFERLEVRAAAHRAKSERELASDDPSEQARGAARLRVAEALEARVAAVSVPGPAHDAYLARREQLRQRTESTYGEVLDTRDKQRHLEGVLRLARQQAAHVGERPELWELAAASMGHKELITSLAHLTDTTPETREWITSRLADPAEAAASGLQLVDYVTAVSGLRHVTRDPEPGSYDHYHDNGLFADGDDESDDGEADALAVQREQRRAVVNSYIAALDDSARAAAEGLLPDLSGKRVLVLVDGSGSMDWAQVSRRGDGRSDAFAGTTYAEAAALFGGMVAAAGGETDVYAYDTEAVKVAAAELAGKGPLAAQAVIADHIPGGGTDTWGVFYDTVRPDHDLVVILTDEQTSWSPFASNPGKHGYWEGPPRNQRELPSNLKIITCNLAGDDGAHAPSHPNHVTVAGMSTLVIDGIRAAVNGEPFGPAAETPAETVNA